MDTEFATPPLARPAGQSGDVSLGGAGCPGPEGGPPDARDLIPTAAAAPPPHCPPGIDAARNRAIEGIAVSSPPVGPAAPSSRRRSRAGPPSARSPAPMSIMKDNR